MPSGSSTPGHDFLRAVAAFSRANGKPSSAEKPVRLGNIDFDYDPTDYLGGIMPRVQFDGESTVSQKRYPVLANFYPLPGQRVALIPVGTTYLIIGCVDTAKQDPQVDIFNTVGADTWLKPQGARKVRIQVQSGGGGGGGAGAVSSQTSTGSGGAGGGYGESWITANTLTDSVTVTVGAAGAANSGAAGGAGGNSSFGTYVTSTGGAGGVTAGASASTTGVSGGDGSTQTIVGDLAIPGGGGGHAIKIAATNAYGGMGGTSFLGTGGRGTATLSTMVGTAGQGYGGGGSGACNVGTQSAIAGGAGSAGVVIVTTYF